MVLRLCLARRLRQRLPFHYQALGPRLKVVRPNLASRVLRMVLYLSQAPKPPLVALCLCLALRLRQKLLCRY